MKTRKFFYLLCIMLAFSLTACTAPVNEKATAPPTWAPELAPLTQQAVVKVGMKQVSSDAGILVGMAKNYYKDLGIIIEPIQFSSGQEMINQLAAGQLDVGATVSSARVKSYIKVHKLFTDEIFSRILARQYPS